MSLAGALAVGGALSKLNQPLENATAPKGVVSLELAGSLERQAAILASWNQPQIVALAFSTGLAFLSVPAFIATLGLACRWLAEASGGAGLLARAGTAVFYGLLGMSLLWVVEIALLAEALFGQGTALAASIIYGCAVVKFATLGIASAYIVVRGGMMGVRRLGAAR